MLEPKTDNKKDMRQSSNFVKAAINIQIEKNETGSRIRSMFIIVFIQSRQVQFYLIFFERWENGHKEIND